jgi:hypothetical protein
MSKHRSSRKSKTAKQRKPKGGPSSDSSGGRFVNEFSLNAPSDSPAVPIDTSGTVCVTGSAGDGDSNPFRVHGRVYRRNHPTSSINQNPYIEGGTTQHSSPSVPFAFRVGGAHVGSDNKIAVWAEIEPSKSFDLLTDCFTTLSATPSISCSVGRLDLSPGQQSALLERAARLQEENRILRDIVIELELRMRGLSSDTRGNDRGRCN